mgnify:CR=1 FL=1
MGGLLKGHQQGVGPLRGKMQNAYALLSRTGQRRRAHERLDVGIGVARMDLKGGAIGQTKGARAVGGKVENLDAIGEASLY